MRVPSVDGGLGRNKLPRGHGPNWRTVLPPSLRVGWAARWPMGSPSRGSKDGPETTNASWLTCPQMGTPWEERGVFVCVGLEEGSESEHTSAGGKIKSPRLKRESYCDPRKGMRGTKTRPLLATLPGRVMHQGRGGRACGRGRRGEESITIWLITNAGPSL